MNKKKRFFILSVSIVVAIPIVILILIFTYKKLDSIYRIESEDSNKEVDAILLTESDKDCEDDLCMVFEEKNDLSGMYMHERFNAETRTLYLNDYTNYIRKQKIKNGDSRLKFTYSKFKITKYDFGSLEPVQTIDVLKIFRENKVLYKGYQMNNAYIFSYAGDEILLLKLGSIPKKSTEKILYKDIAYHIETGKLEVVTGDEPYMQSVEGAEAYCDQIYAFICWEGYDLFLEKYFGEHISDNEFDIRLSYRCPGRNDICIGTEFLPVANEELYSKFPELKQYQGREDCVAYLSLSGFMSPEEIMTLLVEEGTEISFDGAILPAEMSKDGQEHVIQTFEDYNKWCIDYTEDYEK